MPRVFRKTKNRGGHKIYTCESCGEEIKPGEDYLTWKFNRGARYLRHASHGLPPRSRLTNSKMGAVYDAVDSFDVSDATGPEDIEAALQDVAQIARDVAAEYGDAADNMEQAFTGGSPTGDACRQTQEELDSWADSLESWEPSESFEVEEHSVDTIAEAMQAWLDGCKEEAQELVNEQPEYAG